MNYLIVSFNTPASKIGMQRPPKNLFRMHVLISMLLQIAVQLAFLIGVVYFLNSQEWYVVD